MCYPGYDFSTCTKSYAKTRLRILKSRFKMTDKITSILIFFTTKGNFLIF